VGWVEPCEDVVEEELVEGPVVVNVELGCVEVTVVVDDEDVV